MGTESTQVEPVLYDDDLKPIHPAAVAADVLYNDKLEPIHPAAPKSAGEWTGSRGVIPPSSEPPASWSDLWGNILPSAGRLAASIGHAVAHPIDTAQGMAGVGLGALERGADKAGSVLAPSSLPGQENAQIESEPHGKYFDAFVQALTNRYGSLDNAKATAIHDPVGFVADAAAVLSGGAKLLGLGADAATAANATRLASSLAATADTARTVSGWIDPVQNAIRVLAPVVRGAGKLGAAVLGQSTGAGADAIKEASKASPTFRDYMRGKLDPHDLLDNVREAFQDLKDQRSAEYRAELANLSQQPQVLDLTQLQQDLPQMLKEFGVKFSAQANKLKLNFSRSTISSAIEQNKVRQMVEDVYGWGKKPGDLSPLGVDTLKRRIGDFYSDSGQARALVKQIEGQVKDVLSTVPGYEDMTKGYATAEQMLRQVEKELALKNINPAVSLNRLTASFRRSTDFRKGLLDALSDATKHYDFNAARAGTNLNRVMPEALRGIFDVAAVLGAATSHGAIPWHDLLYLGITSPRLVGETMVMLANVRKGIAPVAGALRQPAAYRGMQYGDAADEQANNPTIGPPPFAPDDEQGLQHVMRDHGLTREHAIAELRKRGLVP